MKRPLASSDLIAVASSLLLAALVTLYAVAAVAGQGGERHRPAFVSAGMIVDSVAPIHVGLLSLQTTACNGTELADHDVACEKIVRAVQRADPWLEYAVGGLRQFAAQDDLGEFESAYQSVLTAKLAADLMTQAYAAGDLVTWRQGLANLDLAEQYWNDYLHPPPPPGTEMY
jgi:hypothetical protein